MPDLSALLGALGSTPSAGGTPGGVPGTTPDLSALMRGLGGAQGAPPDLSGLSSMLSGAAGGAGGAADLSGLMALLGGGGAPGVPPPAPVENPEQAYESQLQQLKEMGFFDDAENIRALQATGGNVNAAVERLLA